ncbi:DivIVA domain-containing protein [Nostoc sp. CENA67]|uniref:DivIVA domain-containing protein n=1 Tax=Amazonocrinis nigriterrae CENA67 TaxID=2794033 RepID=A0A8J7HQZ4_9NOST|nr:DivIVA domain-containing protein [Amazonocrinis nigriterrae]MBH8564388.1 DivIVA domain-containing protein [Amazonocrinis nigriterrae CENA67]
MLQPQLPNGEPNDNGNYLPPPEYPDGSGSVDIQEELNRLEELIIDDGFRIPLTGRTLVDEEKLLEQLDFIRVSLPSVFQEAAAILEQKDEVLLEAEEYGQQIVEAAQAKRAQILAQSDIIKQAEREAEELRRKVQLECEAMMQETLTEIDLKRRACQQELEEIRKTAIAQAQEIENGADEYADSVLEGIEQDLQDMLRIITNGRQQLRADSPSSKRK